MSKADNVISFENLSLGSQQSNTGLMTGSADRERLRATGTARADALPNEGHNRPGNPLRDVAGDAGAETRPDLPVTPEHLAGALTAGDIGVWVWDIPSGRVSWSSNLEAIHQLPPNSFDGTFACFEREVHPEDRERVSAAINAALERRGSYQVYYRLAPRGHGERWIEAKGSVLVEDGHAVRMLGVCQDVTGRATIEHELTVRVRQQEAVARLSAQALTGSDLTKLLDDAVATAARELSVDFVKLLEIVPGDREMILRAGTGWPEGLVGSAHVPADQRSQAGYTFTTGGPVIVDDLRTETRFIPTQLLLDHGVVSGISVVIAARDGRAYGVLGAHSRSRRRFTEHDIAFLSAIANVLAAAIQQRLSDQRQNLLIRELRHRSGNLFSQLLALFSQTARTSRTIPELSSKFQARVMALANAHRLITEGGWQSTSLVELLRVLLAPYVDRVGLDGPDVYLEPDPAFGLMAALHEFATNASKYGSLSTATGQLDLTWTVQRSDRGPTLHLEWRESGGPPARKPRRTGFGSRLIQLVIERQLNGEVTQLFERGGMIARVRVPLTHERWPGPPGKFGESPLLGEL